MELISCNPIFKIKNINNIPVNLSENYFKFTIIKKYKDNLIFDNSTITYCREVFIHNIKEALRDKNNIVEKEVYHNILQDKYIYIFFYSSLYRLKTIQTENKKYISTTLNIIEKDLGFKQKTAIIKVAPLKNGIPACYLLKIPINWFAGGPMISAYLLFVKVLFLLGRKKSTQTNVTNLSSFIQNIIIDNKLLIDTIAKGSYDTANNWEYILRNNNKLHNIKSKTDILEVFSKNSAQYGIKKASEILNA